MNALRRRSSDFRPWYTEPAWVTLCAGLLLHSAIAGFLYGQLLNRVETMEKQQQIILDTLLHDREQKREAQ